MAALYTAGACLTVVYIVARHASRGFAFDEVQWAVHDLYRNHVTYATVLALLLPFALYRIRTTHGPQKLAWWLALGAAASWAAHLLYPGLGAGAAGGGAVLPRRAAAPDAAGAGGRAGRRAGRKPPIS